MIVEYHTIVCGQQYQKTKTNEGKEKKKTDRRVRATDDVVFGTDVQCAISREMESITSV